MNETTGQQLIGANMRIKGSLVAKKVNPSHKLLVWKL